MTLNRVSFFSSSRVALALLLALGPIASSCTHPAKAPAVPASPREAQREERLVIAYAGEEGKTALELLKARAKVRTSTNSLGELVEEINGVQSGNGSYLIYFVNGAKSMTGAGNYVTKSSDRIEWKLIGPKKTQ